MAGQTFHSVTWSFRTRSRRSLPSWLPGGCKTRGAPVVTIYPGAVYGPHDPYRGEQSERLRWILRGLFPFWPREGQHVVDVRDVAAVITAVLRRGEPRRYVIPGHHVGGHLLFATLADVTGRRFLTWSCPARCSVPRGA